MSCRRGIRTELPGLRQLVVQRCRACQKRELEAADSPRTDAKRRPVLGLGDFLTDDFRPAGLFPLHLAGPATASKCTMQAIPCLQILSENWQALREHRLAQLPELVTAEQLCNWHDSIRSCPYSSPWLCSSVCPRSRVPCGIKHSVFQALFKHCRTATPQRLMRLAKPCPMFSAIHHHAIKRGQKVGM